MNTTDEYTGEVYAIVTLEDTTFSGIKNIDSNGIEVSVLTDHFADPGTPIKAGAIITPMDIAKPFYKVQLSGGSVALILK